MERDTRALLVQRLHEQLGSQVELVDTTIAHRREDYVVLLATLRHPTLSVVIKLAGQHARLRIPLIRQLCSTAGRNPHYHSQSLKYLQLMLPIEHGPGVIFTTTYLPGQDWALVQSQMNPPGASRMPISKLGKRLLNSISSLFRILGRKI